MEIRAKGLKKVFTDGGEKVAAVDGIDLVLLSGEIVVLVGPSGSGKTTLLNLFSGLDEPTEGEVLVDGRPVSLLSERENSSLRNRTFGFVFQFFNLLPEFTVLENVLLPLLIGKDPSFGVLRKRAEEILNELGLLHRKSALPGELSGGEQQRVAIARALVNRPGFVFADEPTGNLDKDNAKTCLELFLQMKNRSGTGFIIATHNQEIAGLPGARIVRLKNGKIIQTT